MDKIQKTEAGYQYWFVDKSMLDGRTLKMSVAAPHSASIALGFCPRANNYGGPSPPRLPHPSCPGAIKIAVKKLYS